MRWTSGYVGVASIELYSVNSIIQCLLDNENDKISVLLYNLLWFENLSYCFKFCVLGHPSGFINVNYTSLSCRTSQSLYIILSLPADCGINLNFQLEISRVKFGLSQHFHANWFQRDWQWGEKWVAHKVWQSVIVSISDFTNLNWQPQTLDLWTWL